MKVLAFVVFFIISVFLAFALVHLVDAASCDPAFGPGPGCTTDPGPSVPVPLPSGYPVLAVAGPCLPEFGVCGYLWVQAKQRMYGELNTPLRYAKFKGIGTP